MKIRIIGPCGSGKTYIAKELSRKYNIPYYELDNLVWNRAEVQRRNPFEVRDAQLMDILRQDSWIVEGAHYKWGWDSFSQAGLIVIIKPNKLAAQYRVVRRFVRTRLGFESFNYKQTLYNLYTMLFVWNKNYFSNSLSDIAEETGKYDCKRVVNANNHELLELVDELVDDKSSFGRHAQLYL